MQIRASSLIILIAAGLSGWFGINSLLPAINGAIDISNIAGLAASIAVLALAATGLLRAKPQASPPTPQVQAQQVQIQTEGSAPPGTISLVVYIPRDYIVDIVATELKSQLPLKKTPKRPASCPPSPAPPVAAHVQQPQQAPLPPPPEKRPEPPLVSVESCS